MAPDRRAKTKDAEQHKHGPRCHDEHLRDDSRQQSFRADTARHGDEAGPHPGGISPFGGKYRAVGGEFGASVGTVLDARCAALHVDCAVLYMHGAVLGLVAGFDDRGFWRHAVTRRGPSSWFLIAALVRFTA